MSASVSVSVIVCTLNNSRTIGRCLEAVKDQELSADEVLIVDGGSSDDTPGIAESFGTLVRSPVGNRCYQNNLGASLATGNYLLFLDADMELGPKVISQAVSLSDGPEKYQALLLPEVSYGCNFWAKVKAFERSFYPGVWWVEAARWFARDLFLRLGGFDTTMTGTEDWDLDQKARNLTRIGTVREVTHHNEGQVRLNDLAARKAHYAVTFDRFKQRHSDRASLCFSLRARGEVFLHQPRRLALHPLLTSGVIVQGLTELAATKGWYSTEDPWPQERPIET